MNPVVGTFLFFTALGLILAMWLLLRPKGDPWANRLLALFTFIFALELLNNCLRWSGWIQNRWLAHFHLAHFPFWLVYGPIVYIYVRRVLTGRLFHPRDLLFAVPPLIMAGLLREFYTLPGQRKITVMEQGLLSDYIQFPSYGIWIVIPIMFAYAALTYYRFGPARFPSWRKNLWVQGFVGSYLGFIISFSAYIGLVRLGWLDPSLDYFVDLVIVLFIGLLLYFGIRYPGMLGPEYRRVIPWGKYRKTGLSPVLSREMAAKLRRIMDEEKPYLNTKLRMDDLAGLLGLSRNNTSQVINEHFDRSFFDFINEYRVETAKKLLLESDPETDTIAGIAFEAGFHSRASFYKAFRKFETYPPGEFFNRKVVRAS